MTVEASELRSVLRPHASGVAVFTAPGADGPVGVTVTSLTSVSASPALVCVSLAESSHTLARIKGWNRFGVQLLGAHQADVAQRFAMPGIDRFAPPTSWHRGPHGVPLLDSCLSWLICSRYHQVRLGDHHLLVGAVDHVGHGIPGDSLVHVRGSLQPVPALAPGRT